MQKHICLNAFLTLFFISLLLQFLRVRLRKRIVTNVEALDKESDFQIAWEKAKSGFWLFARDLSRMRLVRKYAHRMPKNINTQLGLFRRLNTFELIITIGMLLTAAVGYRFCS